MTKEIGKFVGYTRDNNTFILYSKANTETFDYNYIAYIKDGFLFIQQQKDNIWKDIVISNNFTIVIL